MRLLRSTPSFRPLPYVLLGCDPELFLANANGQIVGSERAVPSDGLDFKNVVQDGVQVELNPGPSQCRELLAANIRSSFLTLKRRLDELSLKGQTFTASFRSVVEVDATELAALSPAASALGCAPSFNAYSSTASIAVDGSTYRTRSAGGHIHLGFHNTALWREEASLYGNAPAVDHRARIVPLLDALVGNVCVLLDRDPLQAERRKLYGRAGEHRLPTHGLEYRTLSNFWLRSYQLMSFVMGMARFAVNLTHHTIVTGEDQAERLLSEIDFDVLQLAINKNDAKLALYNLDPVLRLCHDFAPTQMYYGIPLNKRTIKKFLHLVKTIEAQGIESIWPEDPMTYWTTLRNFIGASGSEQYLSKLRVPRGTRHTLRQLSLS